MQVLEFIGSYGPWSWIVAGLILLGLELVVPGGFLLWMGVAGIVTGLMALFQPAITLPFQWLVFGVLSLGAILIWLRYTRGRKENTDRPHLNRRVEGFVGRTAELTEPIHDGFGRIVLGDSTWRVRGPDLPAGTHVRVVATDGPTLLVEPA